ncbi:urea-proton symporter DUR3-like, partial [Argonauta hians]
CGFALLTNLIITIGVILAGQATIQSLTKDASDEFSIIIMATLFGSYSLIGGLGTTFYVSYFNACLVFILLIVFMMKIFFITDGRYSEIGSIESIYDAVVCLKGPETNTQNSYFTFQSYVSLLYGIIEIFVSSAVTFCDQASWQSRIAAKPAQGVVGFILAGLMWFSVPAGMAATTGMAYLALSSKNGTHMLSNSEIDAGLVTPLIAQKILGEHGGIMILTMGAMALMSTGSGEVMAVSSIIVYDIFQTYINPFRRNRKRNQCILCGETKMKKETNEDLGEQNGKGGDTMGTGHLPILTCKCLSVSSCPSCKDDLKSRSVQNDSGANRFQYQCSTHGHYREYQDNLIAFKNWCIIWVTIGIIPLGMVVFMSGINLNWIFYVGAIVTIPCFPPVLLSILWVKATGKGLIIGSLMGLLCGVMVTLGVASTFPGGLGNFLINTVQDNVLLAGTITSFGVSFVVCVVVSLMTHRIVSVEASEEEWQKLFNIDNPLHPWEENYREELTGMEYDERPSFQQMNLAFRTAKLTAYIGGTLCIFIFSVLVPGIMASFSVMSSTQFRIWVIFTQGWVIVMAIIVIFLPPFEEVTKMVRQYKLNKDISLKQSSIEMKDNYYPLSDMGAAKV